MTVLNVKCKHLYITSLLLRINIREGISTVEYWCLVSVMLVNVQAYFQPNEELSCANFSLRALNVLWNDKSPFWFAGVHCQVQKIAADDLAVFSGLKSYLSLLKYDDDTVCVSKVWIVSLMQD